MSELNYLTAKQLTIESYDDFINEGFTSDQAIAAAFEDSILMMKKDSIVFIAVIQTLALISLRQNFISDYLLAKLQNLILASLKLSNEEECEYQQAKEQLAFLMKEKYTINIDDSYNQRINKLLS